MLWSGEFPPLAIRLDIWILTAQAVSSQRKLHRLSSTGPADPRLGVAPFSAFIAQWNLHKP
jgi:hypothetical protein